MYECVSSNYYERVHLVVVFDQELIRKTWAIDTIEVEGKGGGVS
jgi:hypothetical protein